MRPLTLVDRLCVWMIFGHYLVYELVFFFQAELWGGALTPFLAAWKLGFPLVLFSYGYAARWRLMRKLRRPVAGYVLAFAFFFFWAAIPSLLSPYGIASFYEWLKLWPRALFFLGLLGLVLSKPRVLILLMKIIVWWGVCCVIQYFMLVTLRGYQWTYYYSGIPIEFAGPYGLLGNISSLMHFPGLPFPIVRLCGFWNEPSNASASLFVAFFFSRYLWLTERKKCWHYASYVSFFGGLLCLSNAGYLAIAVALAVGAVISTDWRSVSTLRRTLLLGVGVVFIVVALFGRKYVTERMPESDWARAVVGAREQASDPDETDHYGGRLMLASNILREVSDRPLGMGVPPFAEEVENISATAPLYWFYATGFIGGFLLFTREAAVALQVHRSSRRGDFVLVSAQAWIVVMVQQSAYGSWMNPLYFITVVVVLSNSTSGSARNRHIATVGGLASGGQLGRSSAFAQ